MPLGEPCVIQLTSTPWTCSMMEGVVATLAHEMADGEGGEMCCCGGKERRGRRKRLSERRAVDYKYQPLGTEGRWLLQLCAI